MLANKGYCTVGRVKLHAPFGGLRLAYEGGRLRGRTKLTLYSVCLHLVAAAATSSVPLVAAATNLRVNMGVWNASFIPPPPSLKKTCRKCTSNGYCMIVLVRVLVQLYHFGMYTKTVEVLWLWCTPHPRGHERCTLFC